MKLAIPNHPETSFDVETTGLSWRHGAQFYCISWCTPEGETAVCSFPVDPHTRKVTYRSEDLEEIKRWASDAKRTFIAHHASFDVGFLASVGIEIKGSVVCTMNLIRLHKSSEALKLKPFCAKYFDMPNTDEEDLKEKTREMRRVGRKKGWKIYESQKSNEEETLAPDYWLAGPGYFEQYCVMDSARAMMIYKHLGKHVDPDLLKTEMETWKVLRSIENRGVRVYKEKVLENKIRLKKKRQLYLQELYRQAGWINPNSPLQLCNLFYKRLELPPKFLTPKGNPSTDINALRGLNHPVADLILNIRACEKTVQFMNQYLRHMVKSADGCWYIYPRFHQAVASTGRESSSDPNLQQVASGESDKGLEVRVEARSVFGPRPGYQMRSYDWKNIEAYIPAFKAKDKKVMHILSTGGDIHQNTSVSLSTLIGVPVSRYDAKRVFFGLQYGIGITKLSRTLGVDKETAAHIIYGFKKEYPELWQWMEELKIFIRRHGYIETAYGRKIEVPRDQEYKGVNYYVQGTAGGILKNAKIKIFNVLKIHRSHIVLPIHDEVLIEIASKENVKEIDRTVVACMQDNPELQMPVKIPVSISAIGKNWAEKMKVGVF
jgi:DNA polymerase-1